MQSGDMQDAPLPKDQPVFGYFIRAQLAHAEIIALDLDAARTADGVLLVLDAATLAERGQNTDLQAPALFIGGKACGIPPAQPVLARDVVRYLGEPVAFIVAQSEAQAIAAAELVVLDLMELPEVRQLVPGGEPIHPTVPGNLAFDYSYGLAAETAAALATSAHKVLMNIGQNRALVAMPQIQGAAADWHEGQLSLQLQGQGVAARADTLARLMGLAPDAVRIFNPEQDGFSRSDAMLPEYICLAVAAQSLARQVRWTAEPQILDRAEHNLLARAEIGFDADFRITALRVNLVSNLGAYASEQGQSVQTEHFAAAMTGDYDIGLASLGALGVYTNAAPLLGHHGAGRDAAVLTLERLMETAARQFGLHPIDLRNRNLPQMLPAQEQFARGDGGDTGLGHACQPVLLAQSVVRIELKEDGVAALHLGLPDLDGRCAAILAEATGIAAEKIRVLQNNGISAGYGAPDQQVAAVVAAVAVMIDGLTQFLQEDVGVKAVQFQDHDFSASGSNMRLSLEEAAEWAREKGRADLLDIKATDGASPQARLHMAEVEVDAETGELRLVQSWPEGIAPAVLPHLTIETGGNMSASALMLPKLHEIPGLSETDALAAAIAILNAVDDALSRRGVRYLDLPLTPKRVRGWLQEAETGIH